MIMSMTGFGKATGQYENKKITLEVKSLNSKQTDIIVRIPSLYKEKEMAIRSYIFENLGRGKIEVSMHIENNGAESNYAFNKSLALNYYKQLKSLSTEIGEKEGDIIATLVKMPDVLRPEREDLNKEEWKVIESLLEEAVSKLNGFRSQEGDKLAKDFEHRIATILEKLKIVEENETTRLEGIKQRIHKSLVDMVGEDKIDMNRQEQELIFYLEKLDITEEKVRLNAHCEYFIETLNNGKSQGKKLGFIAQEVGREINTIGSKANNAPIQRAVVQMKDELEKIKEQVLNVL